MSSQAAELEGLSRSREEMSSGAESLGANGSQKPSFSLEDLRLEEQEVRELEQRKKELEERVSGMERDLGGLLR